MPWYDPLISPLVVAITGAIIGGYFRWMTGKDISKSYVETTKMMMKSQETIWESVSNHLEGDFDKIVKATSDIIAKDGKETRDSLLELGEMITKSHLSTKIELKELLELHER